MSKHASKSSPTSYAEQLTYLTDRNYTKNLFIAESLKVLRDVNNDFQDAWNAIESVDSVMKSSNSQQMKYRMIDLVIRRLAHVAYTLHITDVRSFQYLISDSWVKQNEFLIDEFRAQLKHLHDIA